MVSFGIQPPSCMSDTQLLDPARLQANIKLACWVTKRAAELLDSAIPTERHRLGRHASLRAVVRRLGITNGAAQRTIISLADKGLVFRPERASIAFAVPLFGEYLRRRLSREAS